MMIEFEFTDCHVIKKQFDGYEIRKGKSVKVNISVPNLRLFVGNIPKSKSREEILSEFSKLTGMLYVLLFLPLFRSSCMR